MNHRTLIIGGGLAGCTAALELANNGCEVTILEKSDRIGGKVRQYGCKAAGRCNNCGLCLAGDLWNQVENHGKITIIIGSRLIDVLGSKGDFSVIYKSGKGVLSLDRIQDIIVAAGFEEFSTVSSSSLEFNTEDGIISGHQMEGLFSRRTNDGIFTGSPGSIAFIQCLGSRDVREKAAYCSRVCCGYSTRMARVLKYYYPEAEIVFFYMDLQWVEAGEYLDRLENEGIKFIRCRPVKIKAGKPNRIQFEQPGTAAVVEKDFDIIVLTEGIHPAENAERLAELCMLKVDKSGFLKNVKGGEHTGIYLAGCISGPKRIEEVYSESLAVARVILGRKANDGGSL